MDQFLYIFRSSGPEVVCKKAVLKNFAKFTAKHLYRTLFFNKIAGSKPSTLLQKKSLAHMFSYEFCKSFKSTFFHRTSPLASSVYSTSIFKVIRDILKRGSQRDGDIYRLKWRNLITPDSSPKARRQSIPTNCEHSVLNSSSFIKRKIFFKLSTSDISKVILVNSKAWP